MHIKLFFSCQWAVVGTFETRKWLMQLLMTSEVLGLSLQIMMFSGIDRAVQSFLKINDQCKMPLAQIIYLFKGNMM